MRIHLLGPSGSGTSTLGKAIAQKYSIEWFDSDSLYWEDTNPPFSVVRPRDKRIELLRSIEKAHRSWVISGSMLKWGDFLREKLDAAIYLHIPQNIRIARLLKREEERFGERIKPGNDMYENHIKFIEWAKSYETGGMEMRSAMSENAWLRELKCPVIRIEEEMSVSAELDLVAKELKGIV